MSMTKPGDWTEAAVRRFFLRRSAENDDEPGARQRDEDLGPAAIDVAYVWDIAGALQNDPAIVALRAAALAGRVEEAADQVAKPPFWRRAWPVGLAVAASIAALVAAVPLMQQALSAQGERSAGPGAQTEIFGESGTSQRQIDLADGSVIRLDARSRVQVDYTAAERRVVLLEGRAFFTVQHERRPFKVLSPGGETIDLGTRFVVETMGDTTRVALVEGAVEIRARKSAKVLALRPGEAAGYTRAGKIIEPSEVRSDPLDWTVGRLRFEDTPLDEAVAKLSRYSAKPIVLDPAVAATGRRVTGVFFIGDNAHFANTLAGALDLGVANQADGSKRLTLR